MRRLQSDAILPVAVARETDQFASCVLDASPDCIWLIGRDGIIAFANRACTHHVGLGDADRFIGRDWVGLWPVATRSHAKEALRTAREGHHGSFAGAGPAVGNMHIWWDVSISPIRYPADDDFQLVAIARDVTSAKEAFLEVDRVRENLAVVLSSTTDSIVSIDRDWNLTYMNARASSLVGRNGALSVGKNIWAVYPEAAASEFYENYLRAFKTQRSVQFEGYLTALGIWLEVHAFPTVDGLSIFFRDITAAKHTRDELYRLAHHDTLTGLPNRSMFIKRLDAATEIVNLKKAALAVIYIDLDDFKAVNDSLGHDAGDTLLRATARRLQDGLKGWGLAARIGGDEFAILLEKDVEFATVEELAKELRDLLGRPLDYSGAELSCGASIGISLYPESDERPSELMNNADLALYQAKRLGGKQYAFFDPQVRETMKQRTSALSSARDALGRDAIVPFYQPKVSFKTGKVVGFEALLRWVHPREGVQTPFRIKEAFQDPLLSVDLGKRMLELVIRDMQRWRDRGVVFGSIAINVSAPEFARTDYSGEILSRLRTAQLPPSLLEIEVTETVLLDESSDRIAAALGELHRNGVCLALDDFGTGYASLTHLRQFPVSWLKIDRSFVDGLGSDPDDTAIVKAVIALSHNMGIRVVAEGIETLEQWNFLKKRGCDVAQGYLIAKPMNADLVQDFLSNWSGVDRAHPAQRLPIRPRVIFDRRRVRNPLKLF